MPFTAEYDQNNKYILVEVDGELDLPLLSELANTVSPLIQQHKCNRILNDLRKATPVTSIIETYNMPAQANAAGISTTVKRALLVSELPTDFYFLETVFHNQGNLVRIFTYIDEAITWLKE